MKIKFKKTFRRMLGVIMMKDVDYVHYTYVDNLFAQSVLTNV